MWNRGPGWGPRWGRRPLHWGWSRYPWRRPWRRWNRGW